MDRAYFPARVARVPQDVNQLGWRNLGQLLEKSWRNLAYFSSLQQGSGGVGEVRLRLRLRTKAKDKANDKAQAKAKAISQQSRLTPRVGSADSSF